MKSKPELFYLLCVAVICILYSQIFDSAAIFVAYQSYFIEQMPHTVDFFHDQLFMFQVFCIVICEVCGKGISEFKLIIAVSAHCELLPYRQWQTMFPLNCTATQ